MLVCLRRTFLIALAAGMAAAPGSWASPPPAAGEYLVYFGTYTGFKFIMLGLPRAQSHSKGIYVSRFKPATGELSEPQLAVEAVNPPFLVAHPNGRFLYAAIEDPQSRGPAFDHASYVSAYEIDHATGKLKLLNTVPSGGTSTCYASLDKTGKFLMLANFGSGSVTVIRIRDDGSLGEQTAFMQHTGQGTDPVFQKGPHPHSIDISPDNRFAVVSDLGLDKIFVYHFDAAKGTLSPDAPWSVDVKPPGGGPRHFAFAPNGKFGYGLAEMSGIVTAFAWDAAKGVLTEIQQSPTTPAELKAANHSAEIAVLPNGRFLYESNRRHKPGNDFRIGGPSWGPDTIGVFSVNPTTGKLTEVEQVPPGGIMPRAFAIDPTGSYLFSASQLGDKVTLFRIAADTGRLTPTGKAVKVDTPVGFAFVPVK